MLADFETITKAADAPAYDTITTKYCDSELSLSNMAIGTFANDICTAKELFIESGSSPTGLRDHAEEIRDISQQLYGKLAPNNKRYVQLWNSVIRLAVAGNAVGHPLLDAVIHMRTTKVLDVEFGPAETATTGLIRGITSERVRRRVSRSSPDEAVVYFNNHFSADIRNTLFSESRKAAHPSLEAHVLEAAEQRVTDDPALARVIATLYAKKYSVVHTLDQRYARRLLLSSKNAQDSFAFVKGKPSPLRVLDGDSGDEAESGGALDSDEPGALQPSFDYSLGACFVDKEAFDDPAEFKKAQKAMVDTMYPKLGDDMRPAKALCAGCTVREACLEFAISNKIRYGIWGGLADSPRFKLWAARKKQAKVESETSASPSE